MEWNYLPRFWLAFAEGHTLASLARGKTRLDAKAYPVHRQGWHGQSYGNDNAVSLLASLKPGAAKCRTRSNSIMKTSDQNRVNMLTTVQSVITKHHDTWKDHEAFAEAAEAVGEQLTNIDIQAQLAQGNPGAANAKELAKQSLATTACEVIGALRAYAAVSVDPELTAKVAFSPSDVVAGKANEVVTRCRTIHTAANEIVDSLGKYGITAAKLTAFKKKIDAFEAVKSAPRQSRVEQSVAAQLIPQLVRAAVATVRDQLDGLVLQFKDVNPTFYEEYFAARAVVDARGGRPDNTDVQPSPTPAPTPTPA